MAAIKSIHIHQLLRLRDIHIDFAESGVTAIMGANGTGKTTLLQALACVYRNDTRIELEQEQYRYTDFFKDYDGNDWLDSSFRVSFYGDRDTEVIQRSYTKGGNGWRPMTQHKQVRYTKYISVLDCVPDQEKERAKSIEAFTSQEFDISNLRKQTLIQNITGTLKREYSNACFANKDNGLKKFMHVSVNDRNLGELSYPSHYMGAGEQKVIYIIKEVLRAPNNSLILIEELEISLHDSAIESLITFLLEQAHRRSLQIIFNTHWLRIQKFLTDDNMNIIFLDADSRTDVITLKNQCDPLFILNMNNDLEELRQVQVWVEDDLAKKIVEYCALKMGIMEFLKIKIFGSIRNAYTIAGSIAISGSGLDRTIILTDGDEFLTEGEKATQIGHVISGNGDLARDWREYALSLIIDLASPEQLQPEAVLLQLCLDLLEENDQAPEWINQDNEWLNDQRPRPQGKEALNQLRIYKNITIGRIESMYLGEASKAEAWGAYVEPLKVKLTEAVRNIGIQYDEGDM